MYITDIVKQYLCDKETYIVLEKGLSVEYQQKSKTDLKYKIKIE